MPNTSLSLSFFPFFLCSFVFGKKKKELQHIVVFNLYKKQLFVISGGKKDQALNETFLYPYVVWPDTQFLFDFPGKDSHTLRNRKVL